MNEQRIAEYESRLDAIEKDMDNASSAEEYSRLYEQRKEIIVQLAMLGVIIKDDLSLQTPIFRNDGRKLEKMTREEFEKRLNAFIDKALENGYGIEYAAWIKKCAEEDYAAVMRGELPIQALLSLDPNTLFSYEPSEEVTSDDLEMLSLCWQYLEFYPEEDEENIGRIKWDTCSNLH